MPDFAIPAIYTVFLWWFSTGAILYLDGLPRGTFRWSMLGATAMLGAGLLGLSASADDTGTLGAYCAFTCGLLAWAWVETSFLTGFITGPNRSACPPGAGLRRRFVLAVQAILHHELAILAAAAAILVVTWGAPNQLGLWTFLTLWVMRLSTKLNLFLGVRNLSEALLPDHLRYMASFFARRPMNLLFPVSVTASTLACVLVFQAAAAAEPDGHMATGLALLGVLLALAVLEHWFLVLPIPFEKLWDWALRARQRRRRGGEAPVVAALLPAAVEPSPTAAAPRRAAAA